MTAAWMEFAPCREVGGDGWFPDTGCQVDPRAKAMCDGCRYKAPCVLIALSQPQESLAGMWGGLTPNEIKRLRREWRSAA